MAPDLFAAALGRVSEAAFLTVAPAILTEAPFGWVIPPLVSAFSIDIANALAIGFIAR